MSEDKAVAFRKINAGLRLLIIVLLLYHGIGQTVRSANPN